MNNPERWWEQLPHDYYQRVDATEIDADHRFKVHGSALADRVLRTGLGSLVSAAMAPGLARRSGVARERAALRWYQPLADRAALDAVFVAPPAQVPIDERPPGLLDWQPAGIPARHWSFDSPFVPLNPALRAAYAKSGRNRRAHALHLHHPDGPRKTLIWLHGFTLDSYRINAIGFALPWLWKRGYDVLMVTLPFHGARAECWHPFSGYGYFAGGMAHANEAMLHAVHDIRIFVDHLLDAGAPSVGISGLSLGGYLSAVMASVEPRLKFAIPNSPLVVPIDMALQWQPLGPLIRLLQWRDGFGIGEMRHGMALHSPLSWQPAIDAERLLIIGGAGDRFTAPSFVNLLHRHWAGSRLHWFPGNHVLHLQQGQYLRLMKRFMDQATADNV
ncbi:MAG: alpha/beta hydrolase family protein [Nevskia sp.]|uniref:alpha/beta hydrolase family protein n=1 Tax=Nevskia sp. TaxID=1929292 RepID=UPI0040369C47